jgi:hypothetical protein
LRQIELTRGLVTIVDDDDYGALVVNNWYAFPASHGTWYASRAGHGRGSRRILMHRELLGLTDRAVVCDHINGDGLDNRRCNLRPASARENTCNRAKMRQTSSSRFKGVSFERARAKWAAYITHLGRQQRLGHFESEIAAALAYDDAARRLFGEFARLNLPGGSP